MTKKIFIDSSVFMSLHPKDEEKRMAAKNFFFTNFGHTLYMNLEEVGMCDDIVWSYPREVQDSYYPFMDNLHTVMEIVRVPYTDTIVAKYSAHENLDTRENLLLASVAESDSSLITFNEKLLQTKKDNIITLEPVSNELVFDSDIEELYQDSLVLRV